MFFNIKGQKWNFLAGAKGGFEFFLLSVSESYIL